MLTGIYKALNSTLAPSTIVKINESFHGGPGVGDFRRISKKGTSSSRNLKHGGITYQSTTTNLESRIWKIETSR